ncbi:CBS domain-containing protein [Candidatus Micrarchaeota archaeon]|nr:CBS domain-containing protein [Candidatus Micrarchaeota archaeon]
MLPELDEIGKRRRKLGLKQVELARLADVSQSLIAKVESRSIDPSYSHAKAVFEALESEEEKEQAKARDIMTKKVFGIKKFDTVHSAVKFMKSKNISQIPVFDGENVVGVVSEQTIMNKLSEGWDLSALSKSAVSELMDEAPPRVDEDTPISVINALLKYNSSVLIGSKEKIIGIITKADLLKIV